MLYPLFNLFRQLHDLSDFWDFSFAPRQAGRAQGWPIGCEHGRPIAVPASWNDQFEDSRDTLGPAWYQTHFDLPWNLQDKRLFVRFGSVNYLATVWLNGTQLGGHEGGHLPFEFDITALVKPQGNCLVVRVDRGLAYDRVPPGHVTGESVGFFPNPSSQSSPSHFRLFLFLCNLPS